MRLITPKQKEESLSSNKRETQTASGPPVQPCDITSQNSESDNYEDVFKHCSFRVCEQCKKTRVLDERAALKYPLGYYFYGGKEERVAFDCSRLVETNCNTPEDVITGGNKRG